MCRTVLTFRLLDLLRAVVRSARDVLTGRELYPYKPFLCSVRGISIIYVETAPVLIDRSPVSRPSYQLGSVCSAGSQMFFCARRRALLLACC